MLFKSEKADNQNLSTSEVLISSALSSFINITFSHPFDLAHTRIAGDMSRMNFKRLNSSSLEVFTKCLQDESI